jgi:adenylate cyclase
MSGLRLVQLGGTLRFGIGEGRRLVLGRSPQADLVVADPSVSRRHAELSLVLGRLEIHDLDSANGTAVNGVRQALSTAGPDDMVTFGAISFRVSDAREDALVERMPDGVTVRTLTDLPLTEGHARQERALERLLDVAAGLSGDFGLDSVLGRVVELAFEQIDADRAMVLLRDPATGQLTPGAGRNRLGQAPPAVPRAIADRAVHERAVIITESAQEDDRFRSGSVVLQGVRSALCVPLLAENQVVGLLYADTITRAIPFSDSEAADLQAFAGLAAVAISRVRFAEEARGERDRRRALERFFAPEVAAEIAGDPGRAALGGTRATVAILFSDIRGFTALAEQSGPEEVAALLGDYYAVAVDAVFEHGGMLDKFIGDAVMAVWGTPLPDAAAADRALAAARAMQGGLEALNRRRSAMGQPLISAGFGISYGEVFAGNVGTPRRLEYTVVGDPVNIASGLCGAAGPGEILVSGALAEHLSAKPALTAVSVPDTKGRTAQVAVFRAD